MRAIPNPYWPVALVHGATETSQPDRLPLHVRTPDEAWAYGISFERETGRTHVAGVIGVRVTIAVHAGCVGVGCVDRAGSTYLDEHLVEAGTGPVTVEILAGELADTGPVVIRNASPEGASEATVLSVRCFDLEAADDPRIPALSQPPVVARWSNYYGTVGATLTERLRVRRFERLGGTATLSWSDGLRFRVHPGEQLSRALYVSSTYEPHTLRLLRALLKAGDVFLDVGANAGVMSLAASRWVGPAGRIFSFEPSDRERDRLLDHLALNETRNVTVVPFAVGGRSGRDTLRVADAAHGGLNTLGPRFAYDGVETVALASVESITLDDFVARERLPRVAVVKLDIEGGEGAALRGATALLKSHRPALVMEVVARALEAQDSSPAMVEGLLRDADYRCFAIDDRSGDLLSIERLDLTDEQNVVALPADRAAHALSRIWTRTT